MNGRQRLLNALSGKETDRIPVSPWIYNNFVYEHFDYAPKSLQEFHFGSSSFDLEKNTIETFADYKFDLINRLGSIWNIFAEKSEKDWEVSVDLIEKGDIWSEITTIHTPKKELRQVKNIKQISKYTWVEAPAEYFIKDAGDFECFAQYQPRFDVDCSRLQKVRKLCGDEGVVYACMHGSFNTLNIYRRLDDMMIDPLLDEGLYRVMMQYFNARTKDMIHAFVKNGADVLNLSINIATAKSVGVSYYEKYILEFENELIEEIHKEGALVSCHNCGDGLGLIDMYNTMMIDSFETMTPPPFGDMDFDIALEKFNPRINLMGNIDQIDFLVNATPKQVYDRVKDIMIKAKKRGNFILTTSDWIFDGTPKENIRAFVEAGLEYGNY